MSALDPAERDRLRALPKAHLHLHLEGSLSPESLWQLAERQGRPAVRPPFSGRPPGAPTPRRKPLGDPGGRAVAETRLAATRARSAQGASKLPRLGLASLEECQALYRFSGFDGFIQAIKTASLLLRDPSDYALAVEGLARQLQADGVRYAEVFWSVGILQWRQEAIEPYWEAIEQARQAAEAATGVRIRWLLDAVRQFGPEAWERVVQWAVDLQSSESLIGVGIGGDERQQPTANFARGFNHARDAGLHTTIHAGETRGADSVAEVLHWLRPERIGHGLRAFEDPRVVAMLAEAGTWLDVCPTSNLRTGVWRQGERHPALNYCNSGVNIAISTDDPGIFGCRLEDEYEYLRSEGGFGAEALERVVRGAWKGSFLPAAERCRLAGAESA
ncbi:MAG: adenosine deaminase [Terriglobales bacterium]